MTPEEELRELRAEFDARLEARTRAVVDEHRRMAEMLENARRLLAQIPVPFAIKLDVDQLRLAKLERVAEAARAFDSGPGHVENNRYTLSPRELALRVALADLDTPGGGR